MIVNIFPTQKNNGLHMPWDNGVNKNVVIYAAHTALGVRNMPLINLPNQQLWISLFYRVSNLIIQLTCKINIAKPK